MPLYLTVYLMKHLALIFKKLKHFYPLTQWSEHNNQTPFQVLISCILSLRTKDKVTYAASKTLFQKARTPLSLSKLPLKTIENLIYPVGFYKTKAKRIKLIADTIHTKYRDRVPDTLSELLKFKGIGKKTASIVMVYGHKKPDFIPVDIHVHVIANRLGWVKTKTPDQTMDALMKTVPKKYWQDLNEIFVRFGQDICTTMSPWCSKCPISQYCPKVSVTRSR